jgi:hypothetical protein
MNSLVLEAARLAGCLALAFVGTSAPLAARQVAAPGYAVEALPLVQGAAFVGGLEWLPDDTLAVFDGIAVRRIDPDSLAVLATLHVPPSPVFGAFLALEPSRSALIFGESSGGTLTRIPLDGSPPSLLGVLPQVYDGAFAADGSLYVSHGDPTWTTTAIVRLAPPSFVPDLIANVDGPSGPLAIGADSALWYGVVPQGFPGPIGGGALLRIEASQLAAAIGPGALDASSLSSFVTGLDVISDIAFDAEGDLVLSDSIHGTISQLGSDGTPRGTVVASSPRGVHGITYLVFRDDGAAHPARFDPFQPPAGGELLAIASDYVTTSRLLRVRPWRPSFELPATIPVGPFAIGLTGGPPNGACLLFAAPATTAPEWKVALHGIPYFFALAPPWIVALGEVPLDAQGALLVPAVNPGLGVGVAVQGALVGLPNGALGSTEVAWMVFE